MSNYLFCLKTCPFDLFKKSLLSLGILLMILVEDCSGHLKLAYDINLIPTEPKIQFIIKPVGALLAWERRLRRGRECQ